MFVRKVKRQTTKNISVQIAHRNAQGQPRQKIVRHRGSAGEIFRALLRLAEVEKQRREEEVQPRLFPREEPVDLVLKARKQREQDRPLPVNDLRKLTAPHHGLSRSLWRPVYALDKVFGSRKKMAARLCRQAVLMRLGEASVTRALAGPRPGSACGPVLPHDGRAG